jgi:hypothetical protein
VKYQNPASAGFFRIERSVLNSVIVRRLTSSRCSRQSVGAAGLVSLRQCCLMRTRAPCRQGIRGRPVGGAVRVGKRAPVHPESRKNAALCERECLGSSRLASRVKCAPCSDRDSEICATKSVKATTLIVLPVTQRWHNAT